MATRRLTRNAPKEACADKFRGSRETGGARGPRTKYMLYRAILTFGDRCLGIVAGGRELGAPALDRVSAGTSQMHHQPKWVDPLSTSALLSGADQNGIREPRPLSANCRLMHRIK